MSALTSRSGKRQAAPGTGQGSLRIERVVRRFGSINALAGVDLEVRAGEMLTLLGPSGSGKTTLLKVIAGFEIPDEGEVFLDGRNVTLESPGKRDIGMVFQNYALFPHMTVAQNVAFPLQMRKVPRAECERRVTETLTRVDLPIHAERLPRQLSGGQQQRVALARAIVFGPSLLLLDEPFGALDRKLREQMQLEVRRLQRELGLTAVFVTHDQEEALVMSDRIAVMQDGLIAQLGTPQEIYRQPRNRFVAGFIGESNLYRARVDSERRGILDCGLTVPLPDSAPAPGAELGLLLRPERVRRVTSDAESDVALLAAVTEVIYLGETVKVRFRAPSGIEVLARWPFLSTADLFSAGEVIRIGWSRDDLHWIHWS